jgi:hypothetical protein
MSSAFYVVEPEITTDANQRRPMSTAHTATAPGTARTGSRSRRSILGRLLAGLLVAATLVAATVALWPASEADKARDDGEQLGEAVTALYYAESSAEVDAALADVQDAVLDTRDHAGDAVYDHVAAQEDALARAADGFVGSRTADDEFEAEVYQAELDVAIDDLDRQAEAFRDQGPEVRQAFYEGYQDGLAID